MKALQYTFLAICTIAELALLIFGIMGFTVYAGDPDPNVPIAMIAAIAVCALIMLGITIRSFIRLSKNRENPVLIGFLFKSSRWDSVGLPWTFRKPVGSP